jgi:putative RecB family exonuclease
MLIYSYSKINTFEQCPLKFKLKYIDKIKIPTKSVETLLGFAVHSVLEYLHNEVKTGRIPSVDEIITIYNDTWQENYDETVVVIVKKNSTKEDYFNKGIKFIMSYYTKNYPFVDNTIETEKEIFIELEEKIKIKGFIDRLVYNKEKDEYEIHDYKTSNSMPYQEQIDNDKQLALYSIAIKELFGQDKEVYLIWHYLAHNVKIYSKRTNEQLEELKKDILKQIKEIEQTNEFPPKISRLCDWCEYKSICPALKKKEEYESMFKKEYQRELDNW